MSPYPFQGRRSNVTGLTWDTKLDLAESETEVVEIARDYLATLDYHEVSNLSEPCRPRKLITANDVASYAFDLVRYHCEDNGSSAELVHRLAAFFAHANMRISQILRRTNDEEVSEVRNRA